VLCVRWYLRYSLSYRDLTEIMCERNLAIDPSDVLQIAQSEQTNPKCFN
jgi:transposase-like protein